MKDRAGFIVRSIVAGVVLSGLVPAAHATKLHVSNYGVDSPSCGTATNRCRSISQAIVNALPADTIVVGPGVYGDLNRDGLLGEPGEETPSPGCGCMLSINKPLTVVSSDGAAATVIDATSVNVNTNVLIIAGATGLGRPNHGFSVTQTLKNSSNGIVVDGTDVKIRGNQAIVMRPGGTGTFGILTVANDSETVLIESNQAVGWTTGIMANGAGKIVRKNHAWRNAFGIVAQGGSGTTSLVGNVAVANTTLGLEALGAVDVIGNAAYGNEGEGIHLAPNFSGQVAKNNMSGNGRTGGNCGLVNDAVALLAATKNYWGAASGPGADPADALCNQNGGSTTTTPFATKAFKVNPEFEP